MGVVFNGLYTPDAQAIAAGDPMYVPEITPPARDVAAAKTLLAQAGVTLPVVVKLTVPNNPQSLQVSEVIQSMAREGGFDVQVTTMDFGTALATTQRGDYGAFLIGWSGLLDADSNLYSFLHTDAPLNITKYSSPVVDKALDEARVQADPVKRRAAYAGMWRQERADLPILYLYTPSYIVGASKKVSGYKVLPDGLMRMQGVSLVP